MGHQALIILLHNLGEHAGGGDTDALDMLLALEAQLRQAIESADVGEVDGHEIALDDSEGSLWVYGPDAKAMLKAALPIVCPSRLAPGGRVILRYELRNETGQEETFLLSDLCARRNG
jgi:hypothetical protein